MKMFIYRTWYEYIYFVGNKIVSYYIYVPKGDISVFKSTGCLRRATTLITGRILCSGPPLMARKGRLERELEL